MKTFDIFTIGRNAQVLISKEYSSHRAAVGTQNTCVLQKNRKKQPKFIPSCFMK